jgi:hypothetical protein
VAVPKSGDAQELAMWTAGFGDKYDMEGHTALKRSEIARVEVRNPAGKTLLTYNAA